MKSGSSQTSMKVYLVWCWSTDWCGSGDRTKELVDIFTTKEKALSLMKERNAKARYAEDFDFDEWEIQE